MSILGREDRERDTSKGDYVTVPLSEDVEFQRKKAANGQTSSLEVLSNSAIPSVISYCIASITMTVVNKVCTCLKFQSGS